jgi:hypothetical protein
MHPAPIEAAGRDRELQELPGGLITPLVRTRFVECASKSTELSAND